MFLLIYFFLLKSVLLFYVTFGYYAQTLLPRMNLNSHEFQFIRLQRGQRGDDYSDSTNHGEINQ